MSDIKFACVRFLNKKTENICVPIEFVKTMDKNRLMSFHPKDESDFEKNKIYFVKRLCPIGCNDDHEHKGYYRAQIGFLTGKTIHYLQ